jgi:hypothetical protein
MLNSVQPKSGGFMAQGQISALSPKKGPNPDRPAPVPPEAAREELNRVLASHEFRTSKRSQDFIRYIVENTLNGHADTLKERTIGMDVFGRPASYDPSDDATVRVKAGEVRRRLGLYYADAGAQNRLRIELPAGTYVPEFRYHLPNGALTAPVLTPELVSQSPSRNRDRVRIIVAAVAVGCVALAVGTWVRNRPSNAVLDRFWAPVLQGAAPVSLCAAFVPNVYALDRDADSQQPLRPEDFVLVPDQFVGGGDLVAISRVSAMLTRMQRPYRVRVGNDVSFKDLRTAPAILVGYSYTRWKEISSQLRFFIDIARRPLGVADNGVATEWALPKLPPNRQTNEDYAIVTRVFHPDTHAMLVEIAGITQYGTDAAAELVTNTDLLAEALRGAPDGWQKKNLQLVLHTKVISGTASSPKIVATHFW